MDQSSKNKKVGSTCRPKFSGKVVDQMKDFATELFNTGDIERPDISKMLALGFFQLRTAPSFFPNETRIKMIKLANKKFGGSVQKAVLASVDHYLKLIEQGGEKI